MKTVNGRIKVHPNGYGFVVPEDKSEDIHVSSHARGSAMDADRVEVEWWVGPRGLEGQVRRVLERGRGKITGQIMGSGSAARLEPDDPRIGGKVILKGGAGGARHGQAVVAQIVRYPDEYDHSLEVSVLKVLGDPDDPRTEIEKILACADISEEFPAEVARLGEKVPREVELADRRDRTDLLHIPFLTIDPETARDFDDAVAIEALPGGTHRMWVAVADVSHYVRENNAIDIEARRRGCSLYLPNRAIPMLPESLSGHMCSLVPEADRLAMVVRIDFDHQARPGDTEFYTAIIHSRARLDYPGVAAALGGDTRGKREKYEPHLPALRMMDAFAQRLRQGRLQRGALDLDLPEPVIELDHDDPRLVRDIRQSRRDPGERRAYSMIEEFMLAANEAVARSFAESKTDTMWRVHAVPDEGKLEIFAALAESYGLTVDIKEARTPKGLSRILAELQKHAAAKALSFQLLRSLKQATYDVINVGHFGLASDAYLHFTSPIRRYPDLVVHRLVKYRLAEQGKPAGGFRPLRRGDGDAASPTVLAQFAAEASFAERKAMEVEREVVDLYRVFFMRDRVGDVFEGTISSVAGFGMFVTVGQPFIEGLIRVEDLGPERFSFDEAAFRLVSERSGRAFSLGDTVKVKVLSVSVPRRKIDFALNDHQPQRAIPPRGHFGKRQHDERRSGKRREDARGGKPKGGASAKPVQRPKSGSGKKPAGRGRSDGGRRR